MDDAQSAKDREPRVVVRDENRRLRRREGDEARRARDSGLRSRTAERSRKRTESKEKKASGRPGEYKAGQKSAGMRRRQAPRVSASFLYVYVCVVHVWSNLSNKKQDKMKMQHGRRDRQIDQRWTMEHARDGRDDTATPWETKQERKSGVLGLCWVSSGWGLGDRWF